MPPGKETYERFCLLCHSKLYRERSRWWCPVCKVWIRMTDAIPPAINKLPDWWDESRSFTQGKNRILARDAVRNLHLVRPWEEPWEYYDEVVSKDGRKKLVPKLGPLGMPSSTGLGYLTGGFLISESWRTRKALSTSVPSTTATQDGAAKSRQSEWEVESPTNGKPRRKKKSPSSGESAYRSYLESLRRL